MDFKTFLAGYIFCMFMDIIHSILNLILEKAHFYRKLRKEEKK